MIDTLKMVKQIGGRAKKKNLKILALNWFWDDISRCNGFEYEEREKPEGERY